MSQISRKRRHFAARKSRRRQLRFAGHGFLINSRGLNAQFEVLEDRAMLTVSQDLAAAISPYQQALSTALTAATQLPLVGHQLTGLSEFVSILQNTESNIAAQTQNITSNGHYQITVGLPALSKTFSFNLGLDAFLQATATGNVHAEINPTLSIGFDYNNGSVSLDAAQTHFDIGFGLSLPGFQGTFSFNGLLFTKAVDAGTNFNGNLGFNFNSGNTLDAHFSGDAHVLLGLTLSFVDPATNASFNPNFDTKLDMHWAFGANNQLSTPSIALVNFGVEADSFLHGFVGDVVKAAQKYTKPLVPFVDFLDKPVPIISAFGSHETMGSLLEEGAGFSQQQKDRFDLLIKIIKTVNTIDLSGTTGGAVIPFGTIQLTGNAQQAGQFGFDGSQLATAIDDIIGVPALQPVEDVLKKLADYSGLTAQDGFQFPLLEDPQSVIVGILTGQPNKVLFSFSTGREHFDLAPSFTVGIKDVLDISLTAGITLDGNLTMGYDTAGLLKVIQDPTHNPADLLHGFYFDNSLDTDGPSTFTDPITGQSNQPIRKTGLYIHGLVEIAASAGVTISGGLYADISVGLNTFDTGNHVALDSIITGLASKQKVFALAGKVYASADLSLTIPNPIGPDITLFHYNLAYDELLNFNPTPVQLGGPPPVIIDAPGTHTLLLDVTKLGAGSHIVTVEPFHDITITVGGSTYVGEGIEVDYSNERDLYIETKDGAVSNYYNLIGLSGAAPDGASVQISDPFRVFSDDGAPNPDPTAATPGVVLVGGRNVVYRYNENSDGSHAKVLLVGGYGSTTLAGGTIEFGNFIPTDRMAAAQSHVNVPLGASPSGADVNAHNLLASQIAGAAAPADPSGIIGATLQASRGGLMFGGPGNNSFFAGGPGNYEMVGGTWVNSFDISPSFGGVAATYQIDGGPFGQSQLVVRVPSNEDVTFENSTIVDKYNSSLKALAVEANAGLSATAHGIQKVHIIATSGSHVEIGDTSEVNIVFSIEGGAHLTFGGTNAPDAFDVASSGAFYAMKNHFSVPKYGFINQVFIGLTGMGVLLPAYNPAPIYSVTRTFGTNGRTQTIPFEVGDADSSSIGLDGKGATDTYNLTLGLGAFIDVTVDDSDATTQNALTVNVRDSVLINNQAVLTDNALHLDYYTRVVFLDAIPVGLHPDEFFGFSSSVHYTPSVFFGANENVTFASALPFLQTIVNRPVAPQFAVVMTDGQSTTTSFSPYSFGPTSLIFDATLPNPQPMETNTLPNNVDVESNAGSLTYNRPVAIRPLTVNIESNTGTLGINTTWIGYTDDINVLGNTGTLNVNSSVDGSVGISVSLTHRVNILANAGTINISDSIISSISATVVDAQINVGTDSAGGIRSLANVHGAINLSGQNGNYGLNIDDSNDSGAVRNWTIDSAHTQVGDVSINYAGLYDGRFGDFYSQYAAFWKTGARVTYRDELPFFNVNMNGSTVYPFFPLSWFPPSNNQYNDGDSVNLALADYFAPPPSGSISYAATNLPPWLSLNTTTGLITGTVPVQAHLGSPFQTLVSASDGVYTRQQTIVWTINSTIQVDVSFNAPVTVDETVNTSLDPIYISDSFNRPLTVSVAGLPPGLTFNSSSGVISGVVPAGASSHGPYQANVHADDGIETADYPFEIDVSGIHFIAPPANRLNHNGDAVDFVVQASATSGGALMFSATGLPTGFSINPTTGRISGTLANNANLLSPYFVYITLDDGFSTKLTSFTWTVLNVGVSNSIRFPSPGPQIGRVGEATSLFAPATSTLFLPLQFTSQGLPPGLSINYDAGFTDKAYIIGVPSAGAVVNSPYLVTLTASDGIYSGQTTFTWTIAPPGAISVQNPGTLTNVINNVVSRQFQASTSAGLPLTYSATGLPTGLSINSQSGLITGTISPLAALPTTFYTQVTVTDGTNTYATSFQWVVNGNSNLNTVPLPVPGGGTIILTSTFNTQLFASITTDPSVDFPGGVQFPFGFLNLEIRPLNNIVLKPGASTTLTISGLNFAQINKYYKYGPTPANAASHWYNFLFGTQTDGDSAANTGMKIVGSNLVLTFVDGSRGDDDLSQNGVIDDIGGPALAAAPLVKGDFNRDGQVSSADITAMLVALTDLKKYQIDRQLSPADLTVVADVDSDSVVSNRDIQRLLDMVASSGSGSAAATAASTSAGNGEIAMPSVIEENSNPTTIDPAAVALGSPSTSTSSGSTSTDAADVAATSRIVSPTSSIGRQMVARSTFTDTNSTPHTISPPEERTKEIDAPAVPMQPNAADNFYERLAIQHGQRSIFDEQGAIHSWDDVAQLADVANGLWSESLEGDELIPLSV